MIRIRSGLFPCRYVGSISHFLLTVLSVPSHFSGLDYRHNAMLQSFYFLRNYASIFLFFWGIMLQSWWVKCLYSEWPVSRSYLILQRFAANVYMCIFAVIHLYFVNDMFWRFCLTLITRCLLHFLLSPINVSLQLGGWSSPGKKNALHFNDRFPVASLDLSARPCHLHVRPRWDPIPIPMAGD
jgi:hypothetical protein